MLWDARRPKLVKIALRDLRMGEEFQTALLGAPGIVLDWGHVRHEDRVGHVSRVRAVLCRYSTVERVHSAEMVVLVSFDRPHLRREKDDANRWRLTLACERGEDRADVVA
jgi:hypothetical protein